MPEIRSHLERRTLIFAPTGRDGQLIEKLLQRSHIPALHVDTSSDFCKQLRLGAGAAIVTEEALTGVTVSEIGDVLKDQATWSDFPLLLLTVGGQVTIESERLREFRKPLGNLFLLERPIRPETLLSTLEMALRGRERQYQIRDHIEQYERAQEALRRSEKLAVTGRLAASIAHEINNPLESVTNLLYLIGTEESAETRAHYIKQAEQELARVTEIAVQTLRFYREPNRLGHTDVASVIHSVLVLFHSRIVAANISVEVQTAVSPATVLSSEGELRQVLANLIGNAIDAMRRGGRLRIRLAYEKACRKDGKPGIRVTIADTGGGIPRELMPTIFEPFVSTKGDTGTGLGLWVTNEIVRKNSWRIAVRSSVARQHRGTIFTIQMPRVAA